MSNLNIRCYELGDEAAIGELFMQSFSRSMSEEWWRWRFANNPAGPGVVELAWDGDILAGHYAVTRIPISVNGVDGFSGLSGTTMTHPSYRGRGLFPRLATSTFERMVQSGFSMVWGFPNLNSHRGFVENLSWVDIWEVPTFRWNMSEISTLPEPSGNVVEVNSFDDRFDHLWEKVHSDYRMIVRRNSEYLTWRYSMNPTQQYRILAYEDESGLAGYAVFKRYKNELQVVDLLTVDDPDVGRQLISQIGRIARQERAEAVSLWLNVTHPLHRTLERLGFKNSEPVTYLGGLILQPDAVDDWVYDYRNWYITMGDSDVY